MRSELQLQLPDEVQAQEAQFWLAVKLYELGRLSLEQAAHLAGYSKATFMELIGKQGVAVFDYPAQDLEREMKL